MKKMVSVFTVMILLSVGLTSCKKEDVKCVDDAEFCSLVGQSELDKTIPIIDKYLATQNKSLSDDEKLEQLRDWLKCKSCISDTEILCNSCIYTYPPQSELKVSFIINEQRVEKSLDIIMGNPLKVRTYHE